MVPFCKVIILSSLYTKQGYNEQSIIFFTTSKPKASRIIPPFRTEREALIIPAIAGRRQGASKQFLAALGYIYSAVPEVPPNVQKEEGHLPSGLRLG